MMKLLQRRGSKALLSASLAAMLFAAPLALDQVPLSDFGSKAFAKGGEGGGKDDRDDDRGNGGGRGGDRDDSGHGRGHGHGGDRDSDSSGHGRGHGHGHGGDDELSDSGHGRGHGHGHGGDKEKLGRLNAANASEKAQENAATNSTVGRLAEYKNLVESTADDIGDLAKDALDVLKDISNKALNSQVVDEVNSLLGIEQPNEVVDEMKTQLDEEHYSADAQPDS